MDGLQGLGDHHVAVNGDGQQVDHGGDAKQGTAEGVHLAAYEAKHTLRRSNKGTEACALENYPSLQTPIPCRDS